MTSAGRVFLRVTIVWIVTLAALYAFQAFYTR